MGKYIKKREGEEVVEWLYITAFAKRTGLAGK